MSEHRGTCYDEMDADKWNVEVYQEAFTEPSSSVV